MKLRELQAKDAPLMLEWMHDPDVVKDLRRDFASKTLEDCLQFIQASKNSEEDLHCAIVNDEDEYMGTVSLKHIREGRAEFGITVRRCSMGKGFAQFGMQSIIKKGFSELGLQEIYWCVAAENKRALRFYDKNGYERCIPDQCWAECYDESITPLCWYYVAGKSFDEQSAVE